MEKELQPDSMTTVTMKPEYPPSEVYTTSEPPPAYRQRPSNSVQIAKIAALTIVASSFILGAFILASSWVSARSRCSLEDLDALLYDKELGEPRPYGNDALHADEPLPLSNAHALHGLPPSQPAPVAADTPAPASDDAAPAPDSASQLKEDALKQEETKVNEDKLQKIDDEESREQKDSDSEPGSASAEESDSLEDEDELDVMRPGMKLPIQFGLDELADFLAGAQTRGRMNCVVERRHDEPMARGFPFNILSALMPRAARAERVAIICHGGAGGPALDEPRPVPGYGEPAAQVFAFPLSGPARMPLRPAPAAEPSTMMQAPMQPMPRGPYSMPPMAWDSTEEQMPPREMRFHVQRVIAIPAHQPPQEPLSHFQPPPPQPQHNDQNEQPTVIHQFIPQPAPTQELDQPEKMENVPMSMGLPWGLSPEDLRVIHRTAEGVVADAQRDAREQQIDSEMQEVKSIVNSLAAAAAEAEAQAQTQMQSQMQGERSLPAPAEEGPASEQQAPTMLLPQDSNERPHYVQPRSVRSVDNLLHREKRVKRCACNCA